MRKEKILTIIVASGLAWSAAALSQPPAAGADGLVDIVRNATERFRDLSLAKAEGYGQFLGCVSAPEHGAMGVHFANGALVEDGLLDAERPEVLVYEPQANGGLRLVAVEFLVIAEAWHATNPTPPVLAGQSFHFVDSPNRFGLPPFYELHVWSWKHNPHGSFVNWNPNVTCERYTPEGP